MAGTIERNVGNLHDQDTGLMTGYRNPVTGKEETLAVSGGGIPSTFTSRALVAGDSGNTLNVATAQTATVNTGLTSGFGCLFRGAGLISFSGTATVTDERTTGAANPSCVLLNTGADTYSVIGSKA